MLKVITEKNTDAFIKIRLEGLKDSPQTFGASYEEGLDKDQTYNNLQNRTDEYCIPGFFEGEVLAGIIGFIREPKLKKKHKAIIWGMYVSPGFRIKGIAKKLLLEVIRRAKNIDGLSKIILSVTQPQEKALGFYEHFGFVKYAVEKDALRVDGQKIDEIFLSLEF